MNRKQSCSVWYGVLVSRHCLLRFWLIWVVYDNYVYWWYSTWWSKWMPYIRLPWNGHCQPAEDNVRPHKGNKKLCLGGIFPTLFSPPKPFSLTLAGMSHSNPFDSYCWDGLKKHLELDLSLFFCCWRSFSIVYIEYWNWGTGDFP